MDFTKRLIAILLCALLSAPALLAQDKKAESQTNNTIAQDVTIIIQQQQVRFTARSAVEQMQLQVFNQSGELAFDSGLVTAYEINWPFQYANGEAIKSGLYAYTLSIKEAGAETAHVRRGHFIVDRTQDRDGADKLWVTSQNTEGIGTELTVARDENGSIAGTTTSGERALEQRGEGRNRAAGERGVEAEAQNQTAAAQAAAAITAGTVGRIAKFTSATELGNSAMTETNGNVGIGTGTATPSGRLHIVGSAETAGTLRFQPDPSKGSNQSHVHWGSAGDWYLRSAAATGKVILQDTGGNVGIGTSTPTPSRLTIQGQDALTIQGYQPVMTLSDLNSPDQYSHRIQSVHGQLNFFQGYWRTPSGGQVPVYTYVPRMVISNTGAVGIGTANPASELHVHGLNPFITLSTAAGANAYIQNAGGTLVFKPTGFGACCAAMVIQANTGNIGIGTSTPQAKLDVAGRTRTGSLEITGGADFAENFDVNVETTGGEELTAKVEAGMVVSIDPASPGKLQLSAQAYDRRVAGIISGAGGVKPGMMMSQAGTLADGQHPVALSGRVYVWVDATRRAVKPGDLLTTSATPGHAMKVTNTAKAQGAIIGKAMTGLKEGKGLVLVLVTLQ
ncbi:MAG: hypothetical protein ACREBD_10420 [Blastocatellia bacterium]